MSRLLIAVFSAAMAMSLHAAEKRFEVDKAGFLVFRDGGQLSSLEMFALEMTNVRCWFRTRSDVH